jgi:hypothetical protein
MHGRVARHEGVDHLIAIAAQAQGEDVAALWTAEVQRALVVELHETRVAQILRDQVHAVAWAHPKFGHALPAHARRRLRCGNRRLLGTRIRGTLRRQTANQNTRCQHAHPKTERNLPIHSGGIVPSFGVLLRYQVAPQVPVLVFRARVAYLLIHRPTVAVVYPLKRVIDVRWRCRMWATRRRSSLPQAEIGCWWSTLITVPAPTSWSDGLRFWSRLPTRSAANTTAGACP